MKCGGAVTVFLDVVRPAPRLILYGAGHVGERVASIAIAAGLTTTRRGRSPRVRRAASASRAPRTCAARIRSRAVGRPPPDASDFVVILTRCHALDEGVLEAVLRTKARYIGLIGSRRKVALILRSIGRRLGRDPRQDERLHAPVGLRLGDKTPGEIAISILAEVLLIKSHGQLAHSRLPAQSAARLAE